MNANVWSWALLSLWSASACFHDATSVSAGVALPRVVSVTVRDTTGSAWPSDAAPRRPNVALSFEDGVPAQRANWPLYLVQGTPNAELLDDLENPPLRAASRAQLLPLDLTRDARGLFARPSDPLTPGTRYTLIWLAYGESQLFPLTISHSPAAGAAFAQSAPSPQARDVPTNLQRVLLRFDGALGDAPPVAQLRPASGAPIALTTETRSCGELGFPAGDCVMFTGFAPLAPQQLYALELAGPLHDATGAEVALPTLSFESGSAEDHTPPALLPLPCALDEAEQAGVCTWAYEEGASVRLQLAEPALVELLALPARSALIGGQDPLQIDLDALAGSPGCRFLRLTDLAGNRLEIPLCDPLPDDLPSVTIDEVRADPLGPEPAQEYVELLNFGSQPVDMTGFSLSDDAFDKGHALSMPAQLSPAERVLVVGPNFARRDMADADVPDAVRLLRLDAALALPNEGSALFLRDAKGRRLSQMPRLGPAQPGLCVARRPDSLPRAHAPEDFLHATDTLCTPGAATQAPP